MRLLEASFFIVSLVGWSAIIGIIVARWLRDVVPVSPAELEEAQRRADRAERMNRLFVLSCGCEFCARTRATGVSSHAGHEVKPWD